MKSFCNIADKLIEGLVGREAKCLTTHIKEVGIQSAG